MSVSRLERRLAQLAEFTDSSLPYTRRAFSPLYADARQWLSQQMEQAGLGVRLDEAGNLIGRREGKLADTKPIVVGSHIDTVYEGGRYDGILGVLAGIELAHQLHERGQLLDHPLEIVDFLSEESSDFGVSCVGSRAWAGMLSDDMLALTDSQGNTLANAISSVGGNPGAIQLARRASGAHHAFVELHIEQGPVLEQATLDIGIVDSIVGICQYRVEIQGVANHAGTTPMLLRQDALVGASVVIRAAHAAATVLNREDQYVVATVGQLELSPNSSNSVPGRVSFSLEVRSNQAVILDEFVEQLCDAVGAELDELRLSAEWQPILRTMPTACSLSVQQIISVAAEDAGLSFRTLSSGAGHDSVYATRCGPAGMIFIPCLNGRSHCPEESINAQQISNGYHALERTVLLLDEREHIE